MEKGRNKYSIGDQGPYDVFIQNKDGHIGRLNKIGTARLFLNTVPEIKDNIINISFIGINKINNIESANKLTDSETLKIRNYDVYIPNFFVQKKGSN